VELAVFSDVAARVERSPGVVLYEAIEEGVPTDLVDLVARALRLPPSQVSKMIGVSATTLRRKRLTRKQLPELAGHRLVGLLRIAAMFRRAPTQPDDVDRGTPFDFGGWLGDWLLTSHPGLDGRTPAHLLRNPEGLRVVEQLVERMSGGRPA